LIKTIDDLGSEESVGEPVLPTVAYCCKPPFRAW